MEDQRQSQPAAGAGSAEAVIYAEKFLCVVCAVIAALAGGVFGYVWRDLKNGRGPESE